MIDVPQRLMMKSDPEAVMDCIADVAVSLDQCRILLHQLRYHASLTYAERGLCSDAETRARHLISRATVLGVIPAAHPNDRWGG